MDLKEIIDRLIANAPDIKRRSWREVERDFQANRRVPITLPKLEPCTER